MWPFKKKNKGSVELSLLDNVLAQLMENWNQRYAFNLDRENNVLLITLPNIEFKVTEASDSEVFIVLTHGGEMFEKQTTVNDAANSIDEYITGLYEEVEP